MPNLWSETIEAHRREVRDAILDTTAALAAEHGLRAVTMSRIAEETGIGRATLYKYFPSVEAILAEWHAGRIAEHLELLARVRDRAGDAAARLEAVLETYANILHQKHGNELAALLHQGAHMTRARQKLHDLVRDLIAEAAQTGAVRGDVASDELAAYCLHAVEAAGDLHSKAAVGRLVAVIRAGLEANV